MREIRYIVIHCTAGPVKQPISEILHYWRNSLGWKRPGYHRLVMPNGKIEILQDYSTPANGVAGYNAAAIHIAYTGGVDGSGAPADTRTIGQRIALLKLVKELHQAYPNAIIQGHRDFPGVTKACPSFDVSSWLIKNKILYGIN